MDRNRRSKTNGGPAQSKRKGQRDVPPEAAADPLPPGLYLVATPIGNLKDITLRALDTLTRADLVACEDTRVTGKLLSHYGISVTTRPYHEHNAAEAGPALLEAIGGGAAVALVSDAGMPLISDPGYRLVQAAVQAGHDVTTIPGAAAPLAALQLSGLPSDRFLFAGFLPPKQAARRRALGELAATPATLIFFETAPRLAESLADMAAGLGPRPAAVVRELTKLHEEARRGPLDHLADHYAGAGPPKGEIVVVIGPPAAAAPDDDATVDTMLADALESQSVRDAAAMVAGATGRPRREVYRRALALTAGGRDGG